MELNTSVRVGKKFFYIFLFFFPILPQYVYVVGPVNSVNLLSLLFFISALFSWKFESLHYFRFIPFFWLYMSLYALQSFCTVNAFKGLSWVLDFILVPVMVIMIVDRPERFDIAIDVLISAGFLLALCGFVEEILKFNFFQQLANNSTDIVFYHEVRYGLLRLMTTFGQPIEYGLYQMFICALIVYRRRQPGCHKRFLTVAYFCCLCNIAFSVSRLAIIGVILIQFLFWYGQSKRVFLNRIILLGIVFTLVYFFLTSFGNDSIGPVQDIVNTFRTMMGLQVSSVSSDSVIGAGDRFSLWNWVYQSMRGHWVWGYGISQNFSYRIFAWQIKTSIENQYLNILYHNGIIGVVALACSYLSVLWFSFKYRRRQIRQNLESITFTKVAFIICFVYYFLEFGVQESDITRIYTILIALIISYFRISLKFNTQKSSLSFQKPTRSDFRGKYRTRLDKTGIGVKGGIV